ncbi:uncharacterized protein CEXT_639811 [Caerostris extrusa]|uniref:PiggyBac transposable element-derived protein domain-containing protein n=1 Tax=Caerostris extrusa TaxID=172846 RepID=A0AAV4QAU9_CAEEX|nr:uncharacterized protein CEXT_639811 [Caerostris extrusa]
MGAVVKVDQHLATYSIPRKRKNKIFFHLMDLALWNFYILYCKSRGSQSPKQFRVELVAKLIPENDCDEFSATSGRLSINPSPLKLISKNFQDIIPATEKKSNTTRKCALCSSKRFRGKQ